MSKFKYFFQKIINSWNSETLAEKSLRFLQSHVRIYIFIPLINLISPKKNVNLKLNFTDGYKDHRSNKKFIKIKPDQISRIIKAYKCAKLSQKDVDPEFKIKGLWDEWISVNFHTLIVALENEDLELLQNLFNNILREPLTRGLGGYDEWNRYNSFLGKSYIKQVWIDYYEKLISLKSDALIEFPNVGNPCGVIYNKKVIPIESLRHSYRSEEVKNCLSDLDERVIVEIGGGYGGFLFQAVTKFKDFKDTKFILFDIPEVVAISSAFLISSFPDKKIRLYGEGSMLTSDQDFEIGVFPHFAIASLKNSSVDLFYNSCSFSEMDSISSSKYLSEIERCCRKYFMHDNHQTRFRFKQDDGSYSENMIGSELIPNPNLFKLIYKKPRVHGLPEDKNFKHFEYLYERVINRLN